MPGPADDGVRLRISPDLPFSKRGTEFEKWNLEPAVAGRVDRYFEPARAQKSTNSTASSKSEPRPKRMGRQRAPIPLYLFELNVNFTWKLAAGSTAFFSLMRVSS